MSDNDADPQGNITPDTEANIVQARDLPFRHVVRAYGSCIGYLLRRKAQRTPNVNWLTYYDENGRAGSYSYGQFMEALRVLAGWMRTEAHIEPGDRIATLLVNDPRTVLAYFATWTLGATVVPINPAEDEERIRYILQNSRAKALLVPEESRDKWSKLAQPTPEAEDENPPFPAIHPLPIALCDYDSAAASPLFATPPMREHLNFPFHTECLIVYTSGTTGPPKGVVLEHGNLISDAFAISFWMGFNETDRAMNVLPLHHVNGIVVTLITPLLFGGSVVINRKFSAHSFWQTLETEQCTWVSVVPTILAFLLEKRDDIRRYDLSRFKRILCGAGPLTVELASRFHDAFGLRITHGYGLSETTCYSSFLPSEQTEEEYNYWMHKCGFPSIGCPLRVNEMQIHDADGNALPPNTRGEIVIRGANVMRGYYERPDANLEAFAHGWFRSGDEGFYRVGEDEQAYFFITGRLKEIIIRGGVNLSPFDVDEVLNAIPGVGAAMAVGFENAIYGEEVGAYVQLEDGAMLDDAAILAACRQKLPFAKSPKVIVFGDTFPVTSTGKYQRSKLRPLFAAWKDTQFREPK
jgi:long-chain acyl-CoA synthetase